MSASILLCAAGARAEGSGQEGADRFVPSLAVVSGVEVNNWDAGVSSEICMGCTLPDPAAQMFRPTVNSDELDVSPFVLGSFELMAPELSLPGHPRFFVGAEFGSVFGIERKVAREGNPGNVKSPLPADSPTPFSEDTALGQGSETKAVRDGPTFGAQAGVAFPFELMGRPLRLRTSVAWTHFGLDFDGQVSDAACRPQGNTTQCNPNFGPPLQPPGFLRAVTLKGSDSQEFDAIGPALELELDTGRFGSLGSSILLGARAYYVVGDRDVDFNSKVVAVSDQLGDDEHQAHFRFEVDEWLYRVGIGFRLQWLGTPR